MKPQKAALLLFLFAPLVVIIVLLYAMASSGTSRTERMKSTPPVGAGGGDTGGVNAIGEMLAGNAANKGAQGGPQGAAQSDQQAAGGPVMVAPETLEQGFVIVVEDKSGLARPDSPIYLAGNINNWNPGDNAMKLQPQSDMRWRIMMSKPGLQTGQRMEFKFTRGSWELEELQNDMSPPPNRNLPLVDVSRLAPGEQPKIEFVVPHWGDERPGFGDRAAASAYRPIKATGTVRRLQVRGGAATAAGAVRDLLVWLPPGYDDARNAGVTYPVLYLHDGQNLFEKHAGVPAEWGVDEAAMDLVSRHLMAPVIIVGIPHSGEGRISEYMPVNAIEGVAPQADVHVRWLMEEVAPRVSRAFRVKTGPEHTGVGGSSLGAVIALHASAKHPETFGLVLAESLPLRTGDAGAWDSWLSSITTWPRKIFLGVGGQETGPEPEKTERNRAYADAVRALDSRLEAAGLDHTRRLLVVDEKATHTEAAWSARLPRSLPFLFPPEFDSTK